MPNIEVKLFLDLIDQVAKKHNLIPSHDSLDILSQKINRFHSGNPDIKELRAGPKCYLYEKWRQAKKKSPGEFVSLGLGHLNTLTGYLDLPAFQLGPDGKLHTGRSLLEKNDVDQSWPDYASLKTQTEAQKVFLIEKWSREIQKNTYNSKARLGLGYLYLNEHQFKKARLQFLKLIRNQPFHAEYRYGLTLCILAQKSHETWSNSVLLEAKNHLAMAMRTGNYSGKIPLLRAILAEEEDTSQQIGQWKQQCLELGEQADELDRMIDYLKLADDPMIKEVLSELA